MSLQDELKSLEGEFFQFFAVLNRLGIPLEEQVLRIWNAYGQSVLALKDRLGRDTPGWIDGFIKLGQDNGKMTQNGISNMPKKKYDQDDDDDDESIH